MQKNASKLISNIHISNNVSAVTTDVITDNINILDAAQTDS